MTSIVFFLLGALGAALALLFVLLPLVRGRGPRREIETRLRALDALREEMDEADWARRRQALQQRLAQAPSGGTPLALIATLAIAVPAAAFILYRAIGEIGGLEPEYGRHAELNQALRELSAAVRSDPEDAAAWATMGLIWKDLQQYPQAEASLRRVLFIDPDNPMIQTELAEVLLFASGRPGLPAESRRLLDDALALDPDNQKALWLAGIGRFQAGDYAGAASHWGRLEGLLPDGSVREQIREQLRRARMELAHAGLEIDPVPVPDRQEREAANGVLLQLSIAPELAAGLQGSETVYVTARAADGPPAPLAARRMRVDDLPATIRLNDADAMVEGMNISTFPEVILTARVSFSGRPEARAGDLQGSTGPVTAGGDDRPLELVINQTVR